MPVRIVFADDSVAVRHLMEQGLSEEPDFRVVGTAKNGKEALSMVRLKRPDILLLDVEMPVMDGIDTVRSLRAFDTRLPVLMFSSLTEKGCEATRDALASGANDYVQKPVGVSSVEAAIKYIRTELVPKINALTQRRQETAVRLKVSEAQSPTPATTRSSRSQSKSISKEPKVSKLELPVQAAGLSPPRNRSATGSCQLVTIGSSTGGPNALAQIIKGISPDLPVPVLIVQHMPPNFTQMLAERLNALSDLNISEARDGESLTPGKVVIAPGDQHMEIDCSGAIPRVRLHSGPEVNSCRPAVDVLFHSAAEHFRGRTLGIVLTGMGQDGKEGCRLLRRKKAHIIAQDQPSSVIWGMPRAVAEAGLADEVLPLSEIASAINTYTEATRTPALSTR